MFCGSCEDVTFHQVSQWALCRSCDYLASSDSAFEQRKERGLVAQKVVARLLEGLGWTVFQTGCENTCPDLWGYVANFKVRNPPLERLRFTPDLFVHQRGGRDVPDVSRFVEVKYRSVKNGLFTLNGLERYQEFWPETVLVLLMNKAPYLVARQVGDLAVKDKYEVGDFDLSHKYFHLLRPEFIRNELQEYFAKTNDAAAKEVAKEFEW